MAVLFKQTKILEDQIDEFLDAVSQGALVFKHAIKNYLEGETEKFEENINTIKNLENKADNLRRGIESHLYTHSLIPENRGDVLGLLESMDNVIDTAKNTVTHFSIESPDIQTELSKDFLDLTDKAAMAADSIVLATRAFFRDVQAVKDHLHKVYFYEKEADKIADRLKRRVYKMNIALSKKMHLTYFVQHVDFLADRAEEVADRLSIYAIKRSI
jgi:predicted phosphate transport protein (TIGR00153 family)